MPSEAEKKFWGCPELVENLFPFLDTNSISCLTQAHKPVLDIVLGKTVWNKLIKQVCRGIRERNSRHRDHSDEEKNFTQMRMQVTYILHSNLKYICLL